MASIFFQKELNDIQKFTDRVAFKVLKNGLKAAVNLFNYNTGNRYKKDIENLEKEVDNLPEFGSFEDIENEIEKEDSKERRSRG